MIGDISVTRNTKSIVSYSVDQRTAYDIFYVNVDQQTDFVWLILQNCIEIPEIEFYELWKLLYCILYTVEAILLQFIIYLLNSKNLIDLTENLPNLVINYEIMSK